MCEGRMDQKKNPKLNFVNGIWFATWAMELDEGDFNDDSVLIDWKDIIAL